MVARTTKDGTKRCCRCKAFKTLKHFARNKAQADGYAQMCRPCRRESDKKAPAERPKASSSKPKTLTPKAPEPPAAPAAAPTLVRGQPSNITPALIEQLCEPLRRGHSHATAARRAGIPEDTFHQWMHRGRAATEGPTRELYLSVMRADGEGEHSLVELVRNGADLDPKEARWLLERRFGWVKREHLTVATENELQQRQQEAKTIRERLRDKLLKLVGPGKPAGGAAPAADPVAGATPAGAAGQNDGPGSGGAVQTPPAAGVGKDPAA